MKNMRNRKSRFSKEDENTKMSTVWRHLSHTSQKRLKGVAYLFNRTLKFVAWTYRGIFYR